MSPGPTAGAERVEAETVRGGRVILVPLLGAAVLIHLVVLYAPSGPSEGPFPYSDKVVHVLVFLVPVAVALFAGVARWLVLAVFGAHAVASEVIQGLLLPTRSGDVLDVLADVTGVVLGVVLWWLVMRPTALVGRMPGRW